MAITRWDPFGEMLRMQRDMDRIFSRMGTAEGSSGTATTAWMPRINVKRSGDDLAVNVELAGIKPEDVDLEVTDGVLTVSGQRNAETEREDEGWMIRESSYGSFERSIALPEGVDAASISANFHDGMLEIHVPKALQAAKPATTKVAIVTGERDAKTPHSQAAVEGERAEADGGGDGHAQMQMTPPPAEQGGDRPRLEIPH
jgi:HSP20 family protein